MFFLAKFCFWLALVYAAILYRVGPFGASADGRSFINAPARAPTRPMAPDHATALNGVVEAATRSAAGLCADHAADCLAQAARLSALFKASEPDDVSRGEGRPARAASNDLMISRVAPMPVPDPRRQVRALKLTPSS